MQNYDKIRARSVQRLRAAAEILQDLDDISAEIRQGFERLQDDDNIHAESRQRRDAAPSPVTNASFRGVFAGVEPVQRAPLLQVMQHCSAHSGRPDARRSPEGRRRCSGLKLRIYPPSRRRPKADVGGWTSTRTPAAGRGGERSEPYMYYGWNWSSGSFRPDSRPDGGESGRNICLFSSVAA